MSVWAGQQLLLLSLEEDNTGNSTYGIYPTKTTPVLNTDFIWLDLDQDDAFAVETDPQYTTIRTASSLNEVVSAQTSRYLVQGAQSSNFRPEHAPFLLKLLFGRTATGQGWSYSADWFDSTRTRRFVGGKVGQGVLSGTADGQGYRLANTWQFQREIASPPALSAPAESVYATVPPYNHIDTDGLIRINNAAIGQTTLGYADLNLTVSNMLDARVLNKPYISNLLNVGRNITFGFTAELDDVGALKQAYDAGSIITQCGIGFAKGGHSVSIDLKSSNFLTGVARRLPLGGAAVQAVGFQVMHDRTAGTSLSYTAT